MLNGLASKGAALSESAVEYGQPEPLSRQTILLIILGAALALSLLLNIILLLR